MALTVAALLKGLLYDQESLDAAWELCRPDSLESLRATCRTSWRVGLKTPWRDGTLLELARSCLELADAGLQRESRRRNSCLSEAAFLNNLRELIDGGETLAEQLLRNWQGNRQTKLNTLIRHCGFPGPRAGEKPADCADE